MMRHLVGRRESCRGGRLAKRAMELLLLGIGPFAGRVPVVRTSYPLTVRRVVLSVLRLKTLYDARLTRAVRGNVVTLLSSMSP